MSARAGRWATGACSLGLALAGCASPVTLDSTDVQTDIAAALTEQVGGEFTVTCPSAVEAVAGATFDCSVTDGTTGATRTVRVEQTDGTGGYSWRILPAPTPSNG